MKILVVDDDRAVRESLRRALELQGYEVELAGDGAEALELSANGRVDAVVLDILMPGSTGSRYVGGSAAAATASRC